MRPTPRLLAAMAGLIGGWSIDAAAVVRFGAADEGQAK
jgi:hypothetical protein